MLLYLSIILGIIASISVCVVCQTYVDTRVHILSRLAIHLASAAALTAAALLIVILALRLGE